MKAIAKILLLVLALSVALSVCSCANVSSVARDVTRVIKFTEEISTITNNSSSVEETVEKAEDLLHPKSPLTADSILEQLKANERLAALEGVSMENVKLGSFSSPKFLLGDKTLGGNVYEVTVVLTVGNVNFDLTLKLLSDETDMGIYSFDIK